MRFPSAVSDSSFRDRRHQIWIGFDRFELRELLLDGLGGTKKDASVCLDEHRRVIERIPGCDHAESEALERRDRGCLLIILAKPVIYDPSILDLEAVAEQRRPVQLAHERLRNS